MLDASGTLGLLTSLAIYFVFILVVANSRLPASVRALCGLALTLRLLGSLARYWMITEYYGRGDALEYYDFGQLYAGYLWSGDFESFFDPTTWRGGRWWGTQFAQYLTGVMIAVFGPTIMGGFFLFSLLSFIGLTGFAVAFRNAYPHVPINRYLVWIWFFPSLWFWPASIGKEALILFGLGLAVAGYVWKNGSINWLLLAFGLFVVFAVRPHTAAVVIMAMVLAQWVGAGDRWTVKKTIQGLFLAGGGIAVLYFALQSLGVESMDAEGIQDYMENLPGRRIDTGSNVAVGAVGLAGIPLSFVNILLRPFPFEAGNVAMMMACVEIWSLWVFMFIARRTAWPALKHWRENRLLRFAIPFAFVYTVMLGLSTGNLGILARQRIFLFPVLLILLAAVHYAPARRPAPAPAATPHVGARRMPPIPPAPA